MLINSLYCGELVIWVDKQGSLKTHSTRFQAASHGLSNYFRCPVLNRFASQEKNADKQIVIAKYTNATVYSGSS